ncbi:protein of unknown function [Bradyrhizobium sp. ORS 285]|nr:hypothetical protein BRAO285_850073 [Bradyrhizobium sp. ORS 285]SMX61508.1 protein of unknown function [Bradyrhizobium sp. ORS 285]
MSPCRSCTHRGKDHQWHASRTRGHCLIPGCLCSRYVPETDKPKPINARLGRLLRPRKEV